MKNKFQLEFNRLYLVFLGVLVGILFILENYIIASISSIILVVLIIFNIYIDKRKKSEFQKFIDDFSSKMDIATKNTLMNIPYPLIICNLQGNILWYNDEFKSNFEPNQLMGNNVGDIIHEFSAKEVFIEKEKKYKYVNIEKRYFEVTAKLLETKIKSEKDSLFLIYLNDKTYEVNLYKDKEAAKNGVVLIDVDNLEDVLKVTEEDSIPLLIAEIERKIKAYSQKNNAVYLKYSHSKYMLIVQEKDIENEIQNKFEILENIKELKFGNSISVTLSIGIGRGGITPYENQQFAISAMELALSRGGDQSVVKTKDHLEFFGGKSKEIEKRSRVKVRVISNAVKSIIKESNNVFIMGHMNPDLDFFGAAVGLSRAVKMLGKKCFIIIDENSNSLKNALNELNKEEEYNGLIITSEKCFKIKDKESILIILDVNAKGYVQNLDLVNSFSKKIVIDHHRKAPNSIEDNMICYIEPYASSTCELITEILQYIVEDLHLKIKPIEVNLLLAGMSVDTKNFYFKTGVRTFQTAAYLKRMGADSSRVKKLLWTNLEGYKNKAKVIESVKIVDGIALAKCPVEMNDNILAAQVADELLNISGVRASFVLIKINEDVLISGRSFGDISVQIILESLGGGGHFTIAGTKINNVSLEKAEEMLKLEINKYLKEGVY
ncbi:DHH family phosphoesterase [Clostridium grantii]|uniref:Cyclic-di-AMP phosphodiesterase n=1 Tax=Clostridium grantii DSM 8605 TaxID=1121316 RepID=A0A1M5XGL5_9CLOT|nr:DHH family phosphoesterase [Clostridium grantii]SHH98926.1 c-di-AMP phosphodiesterase, consists of a GGDEF-like and DHH domains [Clostridium grantii DSM 8605]